MKKEKKKQLLADAQHHYRLCWGNYKSDRNKTKNIVRAEIAELSSLLRYLSKKEMCEVKDYLKEKLGV